MPSCQIIQGDALTRLRELPDESVQCCVTSPPYFGLRDYGLPGQIGLEPTPTDFVRVITAIFEEVRRVLRSDGTVWLNLGDSYAGSWGSQGHRDSSTNGQIISRNQILNHPKRASNTGSIREAGLKQKDLIGIPWRVAFALQAAGWYLRSDIIWAKPNPMPESVTDRPTRSHEYIFLLTKSERYYYDGEAIKEPCSESSEARYAQNVEGQTGSSRANGGAKTNGMMKAVGGPMAVDKQRGHSRRHEGFNGRWDQMEREEQVSGMRNKRDVWTVAPANYSEAHFATYPPPLIQPMILAGSRPGDTILDPFGGSGTTGQVALELGRNAILIELNPEYCELIRQRTSVTPGLAL